jgi:hypothetical protein
VLQEVKVLKDHKVHKVLLASKEAMVPLVALVFLVLREQKVLLEVLVQKVFKALAVVKDLRVLQVL